MAEVFLKNNLQVNYIETPPLDPHTVSKSRKKSNIQEWELCNNYFAFLNVIFPFIFSTNQSYFVPPYNHLAFNKIHFSHGNITTEEPGKLQLMGLHSLNQLSLHAQCLYI